MKTAPLKLFVPMHSRLVQSGASINETIPYLVCWQQNEQYASISERCEEWKVINYLERNIKEGPIDLTIIFQTENLTLNPTIENIHSNVIRYCESNNQLDGDFLYDEMNRAIINICRGIGIDGLDKNIARIFPSELMNDLIQVFNTVSQLTYIS